MDERPPGVTYCAQWQNICLVSKQRKDEEKEKWPSKRRQTALGQ